MVVGAAAAAVVVAVAVAAGAELGVADGAGSAFLTFFTTSLK